MNFRLAPIPHAVRTLMANIWIKCRRESTDAGDPNTYAATVSKLERALRNRGTEAAK